MNQGGAKSSCVFCDIVSGKLPARTVYEDAEILGFWDLRPMAPTHLLFIPKRHLTSLAHVGSEDWALVTACLQALTRVASGARRVGRRLPRRGQHRGQRRPNGAASPLPPFSGSFHDLASGLSADTEERFKKMVRYKSSP